MTRTFLLVNTKYREVFLVNADDFESLSTILESKLPGVPYNIEGKEYNVFVARPELDGEYIQCLNLKVNPKPVTTYRVTHTAKRFV